MLSSRTLYILIANIAVLSANVWFFVENTAQPPQLENRSVKSDPASVDLTQHTESKTAVEVDRAVGIEDTELSPPLNFTPGEGAELENKVKDQQTLSHLKEQLIRERAREKAKTEKKQAELAYLISENKRLSDQVSTLSKQVIVQNVYVEDSQEREKKLNEALILARSQDTKFSNSPINQIKTSIEQHPDLLSNRVKTGGATDLEGEETEDVFVDTAIDGELNEQLFEPVERLTGAVEFGFNYEQDNQISRNIQGRLILDYNEVDRYNLNSDLEFEFESEDKHKSTEKFRWQLQGDYNIDPINLLFARSDIQRSRFSSYIQEDTFTIGYGRIFFNENNHKLNTEIGPGYKLAIPNVAEEAVSIDEFILRTRLNYERIISETLQVSLEGVVELGDKNSVFTSEFRVQNRIYKELYLIFDVNYKYNQNVPVDTVHQEISTGFKLMYAF